MTNHELEVQFSKLLILNLIPTCSEKAFKVTVVTHALHGGSLEITRTVPLIYIILFQNNAGHRTRLGGV